MTTPLKISDAIYQRLRQQPGGVQHLEELKKVEALLYRGFDFDRFYEELAKLLTKKAQTNTPPRLSDLQDIDQFVKKYFYGKMSDVETWIVRGFVIGTLIEKNEALPPAAAHKHFDVEKLPARVREAVRDFQLSAQESKALEWSVSNAARTLTNATGYTVGRVQELLYQNIKNRGSVQDLRHALEVEFFEDQHELNRSWKRVAITETNSAFNNAYLAKMGKASWVMGLSLLDCCEQCDRLINGRIFPVITPNEDMEYSSLAGESEEYDRRAWMWEHTVWTGKDNIGRSGSPMKRTIDENGEPALVERQHHELYMPAIPMHPYCRCRWVRIDPGNQYVDDEGNITLKVMDENAWESWYQKVIVPIVNGMNHNRIVQ